MGWDAARLFQALGRHGLLSRVEFAGQCAQAGLEQPDITVLSGDYQQPDFTLEYETGKLQGLANGSRISVDGVAYEVRGHPRATDDGYFTLANLKRL